MAIPLTMRIFRGSDLVATKEFHRDIIKIGRLSSAHLCLEDEKVSRIHAVVEVASDGSLSIIDMGSVEGTFVNGKRVSKGSLASGDAISLGNTRIELTVGGAEAEAPAPVVAPSVVVAPEPSIVVAPEASVVVAPEPSVVVAPPPVVAAPAPVAFTPVMAAPVVAPPVFVAAGHHHAPPPPPHAAFEPDDHVDLDHEEHWDFHDPDLHAHWPRRHGAPARPEPLHDARGLAVALDVRVYWGDTQLASGLFDKEPSVTLGTAKNASIEVEIGEGEASILTLLRREGDVWWLRFSGKHEGELDRGGHVARLSELVQRKEARATEGGYEIQLTSDSAGWVDLGHVRADVCFRPKPKAAVAPLAEKIDYQFLNLLVLLLFFGAGSIVTILNSALDADLLADDLFSNQARFTKLIVRPPEKKKLEKLKSLDDTKDPGEAAAKAKGDEGKSGKKEIAETKKPARSAPKAIDPNDKEQVKNKGLLAMLGRSQNAGLATIMGAGGLGGDLKGAIGGITGTQVGDAHGFGALGLKGAGIGGGGVGNTIGVGDIGTKGRGGGTGSYGTGVGGLGSKGSADVSIDASSAIVTGSLDKELIRKVIQSHRSQIRYCYEQELVRNPKLAGKIAVKFVITANGTVSSASTAQTTMNNATVEGCLASRVKSWEFPKPKGGGVVVVTYPFVFKQSGE